MIALTNFILLLSFVSSCLADYDFPWVTAEGSLPSSKLNLSQYNFTATLAEINKKDVQTREGPVLVSKGWIRYAASTGSTITLNCTVLESGDVS
ncbi:hypothetical protein SK128_003529, partial [Halocaridina rubra]